MLVINIKNLKFCDMFRLNDPSLGQTQNTVLVRSVIHTLWDPILFTELY